jgi:hypothetical protein
MLERRKSLRKKMVLPVKVSIDQATHLAHTVDVTAVGARLGGLRTELKVGMTIELHRGSRKAKFLIKWIHQIAPTEVQIGIECQEPQDKFWGVDLSTQDRDSKKKEMDALMSLLTSGQKQH